MLSSYFPPVDINDSASAAAAISATAAVHLNDAAIRHLHSNLQLLLLPLTLDI